MPLDAQAHALSAIAREYGVKISTLAQWADSAGSYVKRNSHSTPHNRRLPPRASIEGEILAARIRIETGTDKIRTIAARINRIKD